MITTEEIAAPTLQHMGRSAVRPTVVVIGAMDGVSFDELHEYIVRYEWSGLFVEPIPEQFRRLRENYARLPYQPDNRYENSAIADQDGTVEMLTISQAAIDAGEVHACFGGMSAIHPPRNGLASEGDAAVVARYGERITVPSLTLPSLFRRHAVDRLDLLCIDAEGWDYRILRQLDFSAYRPALIRCEYINLAADEQRALLALLSEHGYLLHINGQNLDAVAREYWDEVTAARAATLPPLRAGTPTLVTALFDLSAEMPDMRARHRFGVFLDHFKRLLAVEWPMVVFAPAEFAELVRRYRAPARTHVVQRSLADLDAFPFRTQLEAVGARLAADGGSSPGAWWARHHAAALSKPFFLNDAALLDPFDGDFFLWVDGDIAVDVGDPPAVFTDECARNLTGVMADRRLLYAGRPLRAAPEAPAFSRADLAGHLGDEPERLVLGRLFGGTRQAVHAVNGVYYSYLARTLDAGHLGSEEEVLTIVAHAYAHLCTVHGLDVEEGLRKFLGQLQYGVPEQGAASR
jgi:FkbM family methyltransferase